MAQSKREIQEILSQAGSRPRHRFGQNFMIDQNLVRLVAEAGEVNPGEMVIEVGPGTGTLTDELLQRGALVLAVEIDRDLSRVLRERFADHEQFRLIEGDALAGKHALSPDLLEAIAQWRRTQAGAVKLVANLPYNIASPLVIELLRAGVDLLAFTVQKEVAQRLAATADTEAYGPLTVMVQRMARVEILRTLPAQAFWPAPKIQSSLVRLRREDRLGDQAEAFSRFVQALFASRRKTLRKALATAGYDPEPLLAATGIEAQLRPEVLDPQSVWELFTAAAGGFPFGNANAHG